MSPRRVRRLWTEQPGLFRGYASDLTLALLLGASTVLGGRDHTGASAWAIINANGGPALWGSLLLAGAAALGVVPWLAPAGAVWALRALAALYVIVGLGFAYAALPPGDASAWGALLCFYVAYTHLSRAQAYKDGPAWTG